MKPFARVGELEDRVTIQRRVETKTHGEVVLTWQDEVTVFAKNVPIGANEYFSSMATQARMTHKFIMRARPSLTMQHRLLSGGKPLNIIGILGGNGRDGYMQVLCEEGVSDGA